MNIKLEVICLMFKLERREFVNKTFRLPLSLVEELQELAQCEYVAQPACDPLLRICSG